jgi:hypothetical protein
MNKKQLPIDPKADEVAYYASFRASPIIVRVQRRTATQVVLREGERYSCATGRQIGSKRSYSDRHISNVTQSVRDLIAAEELHPGTEKIWRTAWEALAAKHSKESEALRALGQGRLGVTPAHVHAATARIREYLKNEHGIEVDVPVEKKA